MIREKFEDIEPSSYETAKVRQEKEDHHKPRPMILAKRQNDLYENISDDFLTLRSNSMRAKAERMAKCKSVPSFISSNDLLRPDEQYVSSNQNEDGFMRRR